MIKRMFNPVVAALLCGASCLAAGTGDFKYQRKLDGVSSQWHTVEVPDEMFSRVRPDLGDVRILGSGDAKEGKPAEVPYLVRTTSPREAITRVPFQLLNEASNDSGYYYTFEVPASQPVNQIDLDFARSNYDWKVNLEGSQDQKQWFNLLADYRILSIQNPSADYKFSRLIFPESKFRYYRLLVKSPVKPELVSSSVLTRQLTPGEYKTHPLKDVHRKEDTDGKISRITLELPGPVPVNQLKFKVADQFDYSRPCRIEYLSQTLETPKGKVEIFAPLVSGHIDSTSSPCVNFDDLVTRKLRIVLFNDDNQPLSLTGYEVNGPFTRLVGRFGDDSPYRLVYGSDKVASPVYDIARFSDKIPAVAPVLQVGDEVALIAPDSAGPKGLEHKAWLWVVIVGMVALLGYFSLSLFRKDSAAASSSGSNPESGNPQ